MIFTWSRDGHVYHLGPQRFYSPACLWDEVLTRSLYELILAYLSETLQSLMYWILLIGYPRVA